MGEDGRAVQERNIATGETMSYEDKQHRMPDRKELARMMMEKAAREGRLCRMKRLYGKDGSVEKIKLTPMTREEQRRYIRQENRDDG
jgi:hypothetical protein